MTHNITDASRTVFGKAKITARRQMTYFLYLPIGLIGLLYILLVIFWFQPAYTRSGERLPDHEKRIETPQAPRVPRAEQAPVAAEPPGVAAPAKRDPATTAAWQTDSG
jgi:hypothetical protein